MAGKAFVGCCRTARHKHENHPRLNLDGEHGWHPANRLGEPIVGPMGMLGCSKPRWVAARRVHAPPSGSSSTGSA